MPITIFAPAILSAMVLLGGCANVAHKPMTYHRYPVDEANTAATEKANIENTREDNNYKKGVRYYLSAPYLLVYTDGKGNLVWKVYNLPDLTKLMVAEPTQILSKTTSNLTFTNGILTTSRNETDSTGLPKAVISALEKALPLLAAADLPSTENAIIPAPRLYKLVVKQDTIELVGTQSTDTIQVSIKGN